MEESRAAPRVIVLADPNGAGKTTFARELLPHEGGCTTFLNADLIAAGLSPLDPAAASARAMRLLIEETRRCVRARLDFALESNLAGRTLALLLADWKAQGYRVHVVFLRLSSVELALERVRARVALGGHDVPSEVVRRRFRRGWSNFEAAYRPLADAWAAYDADETPPRLVAEGP